MFPTVINGRQVSDEHEFFVNVETLSDFLLSFERPPEVKEFWFLH